MKINGITIPVDAHKDTHDPEDGADALDAAAAGEIVGVVAAAEGSSHSLARADHTHQVQHSIADNHIVTVDHATPVDNDYAKFTANGLEGRSYTELITDLGFDSRARAKKSATTQVIPSGVGTHILLETEDYDGLNEFDVSIITGTADATGANKLHDVDGGFAAGDVGKTVWNTTDNTYTTVSGFVGSGELDLTADIMVSGEGYKIFASRFTASVDGYYAFSGGAECLGLADGKLMQVMIQKNGTLISFGSHLVGSTGEPYVSTSDILYLAANDYVELWIFHNHGSTRTIRTAAYQGWMSVHRLS